MFDCRYCMAKNSETVPDREEETLALVDRLNFWTG